MKIKQIGMPILLMAVAVGLGVYGYFIVEGEATFLLVVACGLFIASLGVLFEELIKQKKGENIDVKTTSPQVWWTIIGLIVYMVLLPVIGYVIDTILLSTVMIKYLVPKRTWRRCLAIGSVTTVVIYIVFGLLLLVSLPVPFWRC